VQSQAIVMPEWLPLAPVQGGAAAYWLNKAAVHWRKAFRKLAIVSGSAVTSGFGSADKATDQQQEWVDLADPVKDAMMFTTSAR